MSEKKREIKVENINWLETQNWNPKQTETAASFYQETQYDQPYDQEKKIIEEKASKNDLNAIYAVNAGKELAEINEPLTYEEKLKIYQKYYELAQAGQINSKVKILNLYNNEEVEEGKTSIDLLKQVTNLDGGKLQVLVDDYFKQTIKANRKGEIKEYIAFIFNQKKPESEENSFNFDMYFQDLRLVKALQDPKEKKDFSNIIEQVFNKNNDGNLALFLMQIYTFGFNGTDLEKACILSKKLLNTEYSKEKVYFEIVKNLEKNNVTCINHHPNVEFDKSTLNQWYAGWE